MSKLNVPVHQTNERLQNPLQAYTLASAVRKKPSDKGQSSKKSIRDHSPLGLGLNEMPLEVKEVAKIRHEIPYYHSRSHLPMRMIVSKMATRKPIQENDKIPKKEINLSRYRSYKLSPPSWQNIRKPNPLYQCYPTKSQKLFESMKKKYNHVKYSDTINLNENAKSELKTLVFDISNQSQNDWNSMENNFNMLYKMQITNKKNQSTTILDEDPLGFDPIFSTVRLQQSCKSIQTDQSKIEQDYKFENVESSTVTDQSENEPKFVWNPVLVSNTPKQPIFPSPLHHTLNMNDKKPSCFDSPCSLSSSSSGHTIAEVSNTN